ncbi:uncharacterized protein LOC100828650 [Brachypodium distachyon]|uniref:SAM domain-containing protein n=1 Tax=Brachypodium distachyon TaxID=15368 RepID=A0A2K2CIW9_BRADI|nr:uncharacterized protein LOC100828650 [Brachypodium distachyon]PNT61984.1 hypothetical protein BRADI_5g23745v3 [Brachypodium distachyon]|eukprot:XP_003579374.2 uncharacterized protein LOC100828650 [Brachypodium distachyon]
MSVMDWHAWLSTAARLEPAAVHEYALALARNELDPGCDAAHLDHDLLRSMGVSVARHRLEILKLARPARAHARGRGLSRRLLAAAGRVARCALRSLACRREECHGAGLVLAPGQLQQQQPEGDGGIGIGQAGLGSGCTVPKRTRSKPKGAAAGAARPAVGFRGAATVHAIGDVVESGGGEETVRWDRLFQGLNPN